MTIKITIVALLISSFIIPFGAFLLSEKKKGGFKKALAFNTFFFFSVLIITDILLFSGKISAAEATTTKAAASSTGDGMKFIAAALATGMSCIGGGIAVASAASAALGALSEDSTIMGKALIFVALAEGIALYGLIISFTILSK